MADQYTPIPVKTKTAGDVVAKIVDTGGSNVASVSAGGAVKVDGSAVTQPVSDAGGTLSIDDGSGSITVDGSVTAVQATGSNLHAVIDSGSTTAVTQATGTNLHTVVDAATIAALTDASQKTKIVDSAGTNLVSVNASGALKVDIASSITEPTAGDVANDAVDSGNPIKFGGYAKATAPTAVSADGDRVNAWFDLNGRLAVHDGAGALSIDDGGNIISVDDGAGSLTVDGSVTVTQATGTNLHAVIDSGSTTAVTQATGSNLHVQIDAGSAAIGKLAANSGVDIGDVDVLSCALPSGASTSALQTTGNTSVGSIDTKIPALGQAAMAASSPVVIASNQSAIPVTDSSALADNAGFTDGSSKVYPNGYVYDEVAGTALTENDIAAARINANRAVVKVLEDGVTRGRYATVTASNALKTDGSGVTQPVSDGGGSLTVDGTVAISNASIPVTDNGSTLSIDDGSGSITVDGSVTAVQATGTNLHAVIDSGSTTAVTQATGTNLHAVIDSGSTTAVTQATGTNLHCVVDAATIAALTDASQKTKLVDTGGSNVASVSAGGALKVDGSAVTQPVSDAGGTLSIDDGSGSITIDGSVYVMGQSIPSTCAAARCAVTSAALAAGGSVNLDSTPETTTTATLTQVTVSSSVALKVVLQSVQNGAATTVVIGFTSAVNPNFVWRPAVFGNITVTASAGVDVFRAVVTNMDNTLAADVYATFESYTVN